MEKPFQISLLWHLSNLLCALLTSTYKLGRRIARHHSCYLVIMVKCKLLKSTNWQSNVQMKGCLEVSIAAAFGKMHIAFKKFSSWLCRSCLTIIDCFLHALLLVGYSLFSVVKQYKCEPYDTLLKAALISSKWPVRWEYMQYAKYLHQQRTMHIVKLT